MLTLIDRILALIPSDTFSDAELAALVPGSPAARHNQVKRALASEQLIQIKRGLYQLAPRYQRHGIHAFTVAQQIYGPSYISFESALSYHGLIPESVPTVTSATSKRLKTVSTPLGDFAYFTVPMSIFEMEVVRTVEDQHIFLMATPLKALADLVYSKRLNWNGVKPLVESLRIEMDDLQFKGSDIRALEQTYPSPRVKQFLTGLRKDLKR